MLPVNNVTDADVRTSAWLIEFDDAVRSFVNRHPAGLIYYTPQFRDFLANVTGSVSVGRLAWRGDRLTGILPLHRADGRHGAVLNSLPFFGSNGGILTEDDTSARSLLSDYEVEASRQDVSCSTWIANPFQTTAMHPASQLTDRRIAQWSDLPREGAVLDIVDSSAKRNIRKATSAGIVVREDPGSLDFLQTVHQHNMSAIRGRIKPPVFFVAVESQLKYGRDWRLYVAERCGEKLAALLTFEAGQTVEYVMPAVVEEARTLQPTAAILATAMADAAARGMRRWNWGGTWLNQDGVYKFKKKWGANEREYEYFITVNDKRFLTKTAAELTEVYGYFYTVPFSALATGNPT